jgi:probable rRNA maturation factor
MNPLPAKERAMSEGGPSRKRSGVSGTSLDVEIVRRCGAWAGIGDAALAHAARAGFDAAPPRRKGAYHLTLALTDDAEMRALNRTWRGKDVPSNVLSFTAGKSIGEQDFLGDVVLAYETTLKEAREQNIALADHVSHLVVHGVLHLLGFDHADDAEAERMENLERKALVFLGIADPYRERDQSRSAEAAR